jgi:hypothetical protein
MPVAVALSGHAGWRTGALKANIENCRPSPIEVFEFHFWNSRKSDATSRGSAGFRIADQSNLYYPTA